MSTRAEFYGKNGEQILAVVQDVGAVPVVGHLLSIQKKTYRVIEVTWAVDYADALPIKPQLRANIFLEEYNV